MGLNLKYGAEAMVLLGIAYGIIKWLGRAVRSMGSDRRHEASRLESLGATSKASAAHLLVTQGIVSRADFDKMTARERAFLATAAAPLMGAKPRPTTPSHLRLVTPSRLPLGAGVHCPGCGNALDRDGLQRHGHTTCARCHRSVSAHIQRGRLTVIVEETADEAETRRRLEGSDRCE